MNAFIAFTGHAKGAIACERHGETHDPNCIACNEADSYCPHGYLGLRHFWGAQEGDGCWRPWAPHDGTAPEPL